MNNSINVRDLNRRYEFIERCAEEAPEGTYELAKAIKAMIGSKADEIIKEVRALGLKAHNCDPIREVEAVLYGYILRSNPDCSALIVSEGFGEHIDGPAAGIVRMGAARDIAALRSMGIA